MTFNKIPFVWDYERFKYIFKNKTDGVNNPDTRGLEDAIDISINYFFNEHIEENGMDRLVLIICASLYEIERGKIDPNLATTVKECIEAFESGKYDNLFKAEALSLVRKDIATIKRYL